jgi:outer membrane immunogenic protein
MTAVVYDWSGLYLGGNGGWGSSHNCWGLTNSFGAPVVPTAAEGCNTGSGAVAGGQVGYRWQASAFVFGVEVQGDWAGLKGKNFSQFYLPPNINQTTVNGLGLFTGQVGYAIDNVLFYVKGGGALTSDRYFGSTAPGVAAYDTATQQRWGGAVGAGFEYGFAPNWSAALEYDHLFMGTRGISLYSSGAVNPTGVAAPVGALTRTDSIGQNVDMVTVHVNYRWGGPLVAKY